MPIYKNGIYVMVFLLLVCLLSLLVAPLSVQAADYGDGSAGDLIITNTISISTILNKNLRNLTIDSGGILMVDELSDINISGTLTIKNGGLIRSQNGANGYWYYDYSYGTSRPVSPSRPPDIRINAFNIDITRGGAIISGRGGTGYSGSYPYYQASGGATGGSIITSCENLTIDNGRIQSGQGGPFGSNLLHGSYNGPSGSSSGAITISVNNQMKLANAALIETLSGTKGGYSHGRWINDGSGTSYSGSGGNSGGINISAGTCNIGDTCYIQTGTAGQGGEAYAYMGGTSTPVYASTGGTAGILRLTCTSLQVGGHLQGGIGGQGNLTDYGRGASAGGQGGTLFIDTTNLTVWETGEIRGGVGGKGGNAINYSRQSGDNSYFGGGYGGLGGLGGNVTINVDNLVMTSGSVISTGLGGEGGEATNSREMDTLAIGGTGGEGGQLNLIINQSITKPNEVNITTGQGGYGGNYGRRSNYVPNNQYYYYHLGGHGGKGGSATINLSPAIKELNFNLISIAQGGRGRYLAVNHGSSYTTTNYNTTYTYNYIYQPGQGGNSGDFTLNSDNLTLSVPQALVVGKAGQGNTFIGNTETKSANGSIGKIDLNIAGDLVFEADNALFIDDTNYDGYLGNNRSSLSLKGGDSISFQGSQPVVWTNLDGGTLTIETDLREFPYGYDDLSSYLKQNNQSIEGYIFRFTHDNPAEIFTDITPDGFQLSQDISFQLDETIYNNYLKLFTHVKRYMSEDGGTNWEQITGAPMSREWVWNAPATIKGNSRLKIGVIPYGFASGILEISWNGKVLENYWLPTNTNPPAISSYNYAILDSDVGIPQVTMTVNENEEITNNSLIMVNLSAVDNITAPADLKYSIGFNNTGFENISYADTLEFYYDLTKYFLEGNVPTGYYTITARVMDEVFNTGIYSQKIYYMKPLEKPEVPEVVTPETAEGFTVRDWKGEIVLEGFQREGQLTFASKQNSVELGMEMVTYPFYQISLNYGDYGRVIDKGARHKVGLPPGEGLHYIQIRYCNSDKMPGFEQDFTLIVDNTKPFIEMEVPKGAVATSADSIELLVRASDNISEERELKYSFDKTNWDLEVIDDRVTKTGLNSGVNMITIYVKDEAGNLGESSLTIFKV